MLAMETCSLFELPVDAPIFDGLTLVNISLQNDPSEDLLEKNQEQKVEESKILPVIPEVSDRMFCSTCQCGFYAREEQTEHYKLDWHRFNLKRRIVGGTSLTAEEFEERTCAGDLSSISGSDSDNSSEDEESAPSAKNEVEVNPCKTELLKLNQRARCPSSKFLFRNTQGQVIAIHQCVLGPAQDGPMDMDELVISLKSLQAKPCWVILMAGGGHFAGAIFRGNEVLEHKTFHRYTVRAKRGTSQGVRDSQSRSNMPKSAGASLRRYNEAALLKDVHDLLESWSQHLRDAKSIFLRAPSHNKTLFFSKKNSPLQKNDPRVFNVPFVTRRATFKEVQRIHAVLSTLQVYGKDTLLSDISSPAKKNWKKVNKEVPKEELPSENTGSSPIPSEDDDIVEGEMEMVEVVLDTLALREFEVLPKRNHKKKKKAGKKSGRDFSALDLSNKDAETFLTSMTALAPDTADEQEIAGHKRMPKSQRHCGTFQETDDASYQLRNDLFTACKTGDKELLHCLLQDVVGISISTGTTTPHQANITSITNPPQSLSGLPTPDSAPKASRKGSNKNGDQISCETKEASADHHDYPKNPICEMRHTKELDSAYAPQASSLLNECIDNGGFTLLHVAAASGQSSVLSLLMDAGWDPAVRDELGQTPYSVSSDKQTRNAFRKYSAEHPSKYNYVKAQMPAPLTAELEAKKEEKKRAQKMLKKQREKAEKEEKKRKEEEEEEKKRFAALSDREKRALAAEKRFAAQMTTSGTAITNTRRCWQCGEALLSRIPFEYLDFSFCSTRCLQEHRKSSRPAKS